MRNLVVICLALLVFGSASLVSAQSSQPRMIGPSAPSQEQMKALFESTNGIVNPAQASKTSASASLRSTASLGKSKNKVQPGERAVFLLMPSHEFISAGETLKLDLFPIDNRPRDLQVYVQILRPGADGEYDGTQEPIFMAAGNGNYGQVPNLEFGNKVHLLTRTFNAEDKWGRYVFNIVVYDSAGHLVQQLIYDVYFRNAGRWGRLFSIQDFQQLEGTGMATGNIPLGLIYYAVYDTYTGSAAFSGPNPQDAAVSNGTSVMIAGTYGNDRTSEFRVTLWSPSARYAVFMPRAAIMDTPNY